MKEKLDYIPINIWDDFYDDGYVPDGEKLETYIYVEDSSISHDKRREYLEFLLSYINSNLDTSGITLSMYFYESRKEYPTLVGTDAEKMFFDRWEIRLEGLTHKRLSEWLVVFNGVDIVCDGLLFNIYSES